MKTKLKAEMNGRLPDEFRNRTKRYAADVIRLLAHLPKGQNEVRVLAKQLLRSGTFVAAHVREACRARFDDEFVSKPGEALHEAEESMLWLKLLHEECGISASLTTPLEQESSEMIAIFTTMIKCTKEKQK